MKLGIITLGRALDFLVWRNGFQIIQPVWHVDTASAVTEAPGAVGLFVHIRVIIPNFICRYCSIANQCWQTPQKAVAALNTQELF